MFQKFKKLFVSIADLAEPKDLLRVINSLQNNIENAIAPLSSNIQNDTTVLTNVSLKHGQVNVVNHLLNRKLSGWNVVRLRSQATVWDSQDSNTNPGQTLHLETSADVIVDLVVF